MIGWRVTLVLPGDRGYRVLNASNQSPGDVLVMTAPAGGRSLPGRCRADRVRPPGVRPAALSGPRSLTAPRRPAGPSNSAGRASATRTQARPSSSATSARPWAAGDGAWAQGLAGRGGLPGRRPGAPDGRAGRRRRPPQPPLTVHSPRAGAGSSMTDRIPRSPSPPQELHRPARSAGPCGIWMSALAAAGSAGGQAVAGHTDQTAAASPSC